VTICALVGAIGVAGADVVVNEIMYNSLENPSDVEFIELYNSGPADVDLTGWYLLDSDLLHTRCPLSGVLPAGGYLVVAGYLDRFQPKYPGAACVQPRSFDGDTDGDGTVDGWSLGNSGDEVRLFNASGLQVDYVKFTDTTPWPASADGGGPSLELKHPALENSAAASWGVSSYPPNQGTPCARNDAYAEDQAPLVSEVQRDRPLPVATDSVWVTARVTDDRGLASVQLFVDDGAGFAPRPMFDDGFHDDGFAGDALFGADPIAPHPDGTRVRYYVAATDTLPQTARDPALAPADYYAYTVGHRPVRLVINELLARNQAGIVDEAGQHEDWLEVRNLEPVTVDLGGMFLANDLDRPREWRFPAPTPLAPGERLLVWCDNDLSQGPLHAAFKLDAAGGLAAIFDSVDLGNTAVDVVRHGPSAPDVSFGYLPEIADAPEYLATPTPGASNDGALPFSPVVISEFLATTSTGLPDDWIELYNRGASAVDISGWRISDDTNPANPYVLPPGTVLPAGGFLVIDEPTLGFGFSSDGSEVIVLTAPDGATGQDFYDNGPQTPDLSEGRLPTGQAFWRFFRVPSRGNLNTCPNTPPTLPPVTGLRAARDGTIVRLSWTPVVTAGRYDAVRGDPALLRSTAGDFGSAVSGCIENNGVDAAAWIPSAGTSEFYVVRASSLYCDQGSYDDGTEAAPRDAGIAHSAGACP
jgi:hypothetical protein